MNVTLYITRTGDMIRFGTPAQVTLYDHPTVSRAWIRRVEVELPDGFFLDKNQAGLPAICRGEDAFELIANSDETPCIIDHINYGKYIPLTVVSEGWDE
mgnify:CR=1 FL=1